MKPEKIATAGNHGSKIRSDCFVSVQTLESGGIRVELESKVKILYGNDNVSMITEMLNFFGVANAKVEIRDSGALPFVMLARLEAAIKKLVETDKSYLPEIIQENKYETEKDKSRFSRLYLPGNTPGLMINAGLHKPDGLILDLEDAVAFDKKHEARYLVRNALRALNFYGAEKMVRINQVPAGFDDLDYIIPHGVNLVLVPKCESAAQIRELNERIHRIHTDMSISRNVWLMPIIESALGVIKAWEIATAADNVVALAIGLEDYTADIGTRRTAEGTESFFARAQVVNACKAARIQAIDSVFSDVADMDALKENVLKSKALGFDGMGCIHPRQIKVIHGNFAPDAGEIEKAKKIVNAFIEAGEKGLGVVSLGTKMIDPPVVKRAEKTIGLAIKFGLINENWREEMQAENDNTKS